ncbi:hypothetical protein ACFWHT_09195 [Microbacterium sp. NPDC058342]|uniref:hypothetical protein n=1 Tax=Microbacterium sp. NPDC058342 TaxID=3346454 RepID=UPI003660CF32
MTTLSRPRLGVSAGAAAVMLIMMMILAPSSSSFAYWSASSDPLTRPLNTAAVPVIPDLKCTSMSPVVSSYAALSWDPAQLGTAPGSVTYEVWLRSADRATRVQVSRTNPTARTENIYASLSDLLGGLTDLLLGGKPIYAEVITVHSSGWRSAPSDGEPIVRTGLLPGVLGGFRCQ